MAEEFNPDQYLEEFDPTSYLAEQDVGDEPALDIPQADPATDITQAEAALGGLQSGAMLGFRGELAGAVGAPAYLYGKYGSVGEAFEHRGELGEEYRRIRDEEDILQAQQAEAHPKTFMAGEFGGALLTPSLGVAKLGKLGKLQKLEKTFKSQKALKALAGVKGKTKLQLAAQLAAGGAATGLGLSKAELTQPTEESIQQAALDVAIGGALGIAVPAAMQKVGKGIKRVFDPVAMKKKAEQTIFRSVKSNAKMKQKEFIKNRKQEAGIGEALLQKVYDPEVGKEVPLMSYARNPEDLSRKIDLALTKQYNELRKPFGAAQMLIDQAEPLLRKQRLERLGPAGAKGTDLTDNIMSSLKTDFKKIVDMHGDGPEFKNSKKRVLAFLKQHEQALTGYDLKELTKVKRILNNKVSEKSWLQALASGNIQEEQEIWKNLSFKIKEHVENLATKVSSKQEDLGLSIKSVNKKISQLFDTKNLAEYDATHPTTMPSLLQTKYSAPLVASMWHPSLAGVALGTYMIEKSSGRKIGNVAQLISAKGLNSLSKQIARSEKDGAIALAKKITDLGSLPVVERAGVLTQILTANEDISGITVSKPSSTERVSSGINSPTNINKFEPDQLSELHQKFVTKYGENDVHAQALGKILAQEKTSRRKARQFTLNSTPAFQEKIKEIYGETKDEAK